MNIPETNIFVSTVMIGWTSLGVAEWLLEQQNTINIVSARTRPQYTVMVPFIASLFSHSVAQRGIRKKNYIFLEKLVIFLNTLFVKWRKKHINWHIIITSQVFMDFIMICATCTTTETLKQMMIIASTEVYEK